MSWQRPNIGSRVTREGHARFWERPGVKFLRATRQWRLEDLNQIQKFRQAFATNPVRVREQKNKILLRAAPWSTHLLTEQTYGYPDGLALEGMSEVFRWKAFALLYHDVMGRDRRRCFSGLDMGHSVGFDECDN
jgi:hypothetical protein